MHNIYVVSTCMIVFIYAVSSQDSSRECVLVSPCKCRYQNGAEIDLSTLRASVIDKPRIINGTQYFYNPCPTSDETSCPGNAAFCSKDGDDHFEILGTVQNVTFGLNATDNTNYVQYTYQSNNITRTTVLVLQCSQSANNVIEPDPIIPTRLILHSRAACVMAAPTSDDEEEILSSGSLLVIIVLVFGALYFLGGMAILKFIRGASGVEIIPHYEFWSELPYLVRDGITFTMSGCQGSASYDRI